MSKLSILLRPIALTQTPKGCRGIVSSVCPCPFCKGKTQTIQVTPEAFFVCCSACGAQGPTGHRGTDAVLAWNQCQPIAPVKAGGSNRRKLNPHQVSEIKAKLNDVRNYRTQQSLANEYGVSRETITKIISGEHWSGVK